MTWTNCRPHDDVTTFAAKRPIEWIKRLAIVRKTWKHSIGTPIALIVCICRDRPSNGWHLNGGTRHNRFRCIIRLGQFCSNRALLNSMPSFRCPRVFATTHDGRHLACSFWTPFFLISLSPNDKLECTFIPINLHKQPKSTIESPHPNNLEHTSCLPMEFMVRSFGRIRILA